MRLNSKQIAEFTGATVIVEALEAGFPADHLVSVATRGEALNELDTHLEPGDAVLVKASHSMELERIVRGLLA